MKINSIVLKTASLCNLNCSYCYVYNKGDDTYKNMPKIFAKSLIPILLKRILEYMEKKDLKKYNIIFHGGEPLLAGIEYYKYFISEYQRTFKDTFKEINFIMQTNGTLLNEKYVHDLNKLSISIGISMDGTEKTNSKYRVYHNNKSSYKEIKNGIDLCNMILGNSGVLSVINIEDKPSDVYDQYKKLKISFVNLLFPDENQDTIIINDTRGKIGKWLVEMFNLWFFDKSAERPEILLFSTLIKLILSLPEGNDVMGKRFGATMIIETNGDIQTNDTLRVSKPGITHSKFNINKDNLDSIENIKLAELYYYAHHRLPFMCQNCDLEEICAGGYLVNRYSKKNGFNNESVYCEDLAEFICHVQNIIAVEIYDELKLEKLNLSNLINNIRFNKAKYHENIYLQSF